MPGSNRCDGLGMSTWVSSVRVPGSMRIGGAGHRAVDRLLSCPRTVTWTGRPAFTFDAYAWGTLTNTRSASTCATSNRPFAAPVTLVGATAVLLMGLPAVINAPTSTFRWITVPLNGREHTLERGQLLEALDVGLVGWTFASAAATAACAVRYAATF